MSFDVYFQSFPADAATIDDVPDEYDPPPLGPLDDIIAKLSAALPGLSLDEDGFGSIDGNGFSAEIDIGNEDPCLSIMVALRGGPGGAAVIDAICTATGFRAAAPGIDKLISKADDLGASFARWRAYRDGIMSDTESDHQAEQSDEEH